MFRVGADDVRALEQLMDECQKDLEPLQLVHPAGRRPGERLPAPGAHRLPARRARDPAPGREETIGAFVLPYVNRLSDLLFVLSRWIGKQDGEREYLWERGLRNQRAAGRGARSGGATAPLRCRTKPSDTR